MEIKIKINQKMLPVFGGSTPARLLVSVHRHVCCAGGMCAWFLQVVGFQVVSRGVNDDVILDDVVADLPLRVPRN